MGIPTTHPICQQGSLTRNAKGRGFLSDKPPEIKEGVVLSKPNPNSNSIYIGLRLDIVVTVNPPTPPTPNFQPLLDMLGS